VSDAKARWDAFLGKVRARLAEILEEADAGFDEIVSVEVIDPGPITSAQNEVRARLHALTDKIDASFSKLEGELGDHADAAQDEGRALSDEILEAAEAIEASSQKKWVKRLRELAAQERAARKLNCSRCGATLPEPEIQHRVVNVTCSHCEAVNTVRPGAAMAMLGGK
jgi:hypothetical protein